MKFNLQTDGAETLGLKSSAWDFSNPPADSGAIEDEIVRLMNEEGGVGFAANQMGFLYRVFAINLGAEIVFFYNPEVIEHGTEVVAMTEGCLSFPGLFMKVKRPATATIRYQDRDGTVYTQELTGLTARCFLHELDHLDGICFTDRVSKLTLSMAQNKRAKNERKK